MSNDIKLVIKFRTDGLYIPSFNKTNNYWNLEKKMIILGSAHNQKEIQEKISQKCDAIFLSPAFHIKKSKKYLGLHKFNYLANRNKINTFALGGVSLKNINKLKLFNIDGFGAITLFKKKPAFKRPVFIKNNFF